MASNVIHIINLNNFLEQNRLAQYLLSYNKIMEPNMEFKIWTEKDQDIKDALGLCKNEWPLDFKAGVFLPTYILYKYGGFYCEMDYELLRPNYLYNLTLKNQRILESPLYENLCINNGFVSYFPTANDSYLRRLLDIYLEYYTIGSDWFISSFSSAIKFGFSKKELNELRDIAAENFKYSHDYIFHISNLRGTKDVIICTLSQFEKLFSKKQSRINRYFIYTDDEKLLEQKPLEIKGLTLEYWQTLFYDKETLKKYYNLIKSYTDKNIILMNKSLVN